jgi:citrate lyase subunit beta/citryl-CoA lyase
VTRPAPAAVVAPLFVPALDPRKLAKAVTLAEAVIIDLEDAVADDRKAEARAWVAGLGAGGRGGRWVRVNAAETGACRADILAAGPGADAIVLPKCRGAADVAEAAAALDAAGADSVLIPIVETALGLENATAIAHAAPGRVVRISLGLGDLARDMEVGWEPAGPLSVHARCRIAVASRAAGLAKPIDSVIPRLDDPGMLAADVAAGRAAGFGGKFCIHPKQLEAVLGGFRSSEAELDLARRIVEAFAAAVAAGRATAVVDGNFVDYPVAEMSEARLAAAGRPTGRLAPRRNMQES